MTQIAGASLSLRDTLTSSLGTPLRGADGLAHLDVGGVSLVYVAASFDSAISVFSFDETDGLTPLGAVSDTAQTTLGLVSDVIGVEVGATPFVVAASATESGVTAFAAAQSGTLLTVTDSVEQSGAAQALLGAPESLASLSSYSGSYVYVADSAGDGISVFNLSQAGDLSLVQTVADSSDAARELEGVAHVHSFELNLQNYLVATSPADQGLSVFAIDAADGRLTAVADWDGGAGFAGAMGASTAQIAGATYLFVPAQNTATLHVLRFDGQSLTAVQALSAPGPLTGITDAQVIAAGDARLLAVTSASRAGIEVFDIETDPLTGRVGTLSPRQTLSEAMGDGALEGALSLSVTYSAAAPHVFVTSSQDHALNLFEVGGGDDALDGTGHDDLILGQGGDDILSAFGGDDTVTGGAGADIVFAGSGEDTVIAGPGNDVLYGGSGFDTLDMQAFTGAALGVTVDLFNDRVFLPDGTRQFATDFEQVLGTDQADVLIGQEKDNDLQGGGGADVLRGREGADTLRGGDGDDMLIAGDDADRLEGGDGQDMLNGGTGADTLFGGADADSMFGGFGADVLDGGDGADLLRGNEDDDSLTGLDGDDDLRGGDGDDLLFGNAGDDYLAGDAGTDILNGGAGADSLGGGAGADTFQFWSALFGGGGFNTVRDFEDGSDRIDLSDYGFASHNAVLDLAVQRGWGLRIDLADGQTVALEGVVLADLGADDFIL